MKDRLKTKDGRDTTCVYGFLSTLLLLLETPPRPTHLAVVFDAEGKNFRHEMYPDYKANRPPAPVEVIQAFGLIK
jgi:DNA polymerase I